MTKPLSIKEERYVLEQLKEAEFLDNGASRCVFECPREIGDYLGFNADNYIIKLACGIGGIRQTEAEVSCYLDNSNSPLAKIIAYGRYIEIMEKVEIDNDYRDFAEYCYEDEEIPYDMFYEYSGGDMSEEDANDEAEEAYDVIIQLHDIFGHTADNGQLGRNSDGKLVAYDYGFITGVGCDAQTSNITDYVYDTIQRNAYIDAVVDLLDKSIEMLEAWEDAFCEGDTEIYDHDKSYAYCKFVVYGYDNKNQTFKHQYRNMNIVKEVIKQLVDYVVVKKIKRLDRENWEEMTKEKVVLFQQGNRAVEFAEEL